METKVSIKGLFNEKENELLACLKRADSVNHPTHKGDISENAWINFFKEYLPSRYEVCTGIIIDSNGNTSEQIDVIIYDKFYSPIVFSDKNTKYVLVESVFAAFEVKQTLSTQHINYAIKKYNTISKLSPTNKEILMADGRKIKKTILSPVISGILVKKNELKKIPENTLNFICCLNNILKVDFKENKLTVKENVLLNLLMSLVQSLQMVGNPPAIEFNKYWEEEKK